MRPVEQIPVDMDNSNRNENIINFKHSPTPNLKVKISKDSKMILFTDDKEKFILKRQGQFYQ